MNTNVIDHRIVTAEFGRLHVRKASRRVSLIRRFKNLIELGDWDETIIRHGREIDLFCWMLAGGAAALLLPVCFLVMKG